jgi:hypothetical protein
MNFLQDAVERVAHGDVAYEAGASALLGVIFHLSIRPIEFEFIMYHFMAASTLILVATVYVFGLVKASLFAASFNTGLLTSIVVYRLFFHRCRNFPGPLSAKVSKFHAARLATKDVQYYKELAKMHEQYGDFVRTGKHLHLSMQEGG